MITNFLSIKSTPSLSISIVILEIILELPGVMRVLQFRVDEIKLGF